VEFQSFSKLLLAVEAAVEGNNNIQCELLFRAFNAKGNGKLTKVGAVLAGWLVGWIFSYVVGYFWLEGIGWLPVGGGCSQVSF